MKETKGSTKVGIIVALIASVFVIIASILVVNATLNATNYDDYNFYSIIQPDRHNGEIGDHVKGDKDAPVLVFEFADFQCPGCASINTRVNEAIKQSDGKLAVVYRNYLLSYHKNGTAAASAAEAAGLQGYWKEYADKLFLEQTEWEYASSSERTALFNQYFTEVTNGKGDLDKFNEDISSDRVSQKIKFDMGIGKRVGVKGTPAFFIDGQLIDWGNSEGGSIKINDKEVSWDHQLTGSEFAELLLGIVEAKLGN